MLETLSRRRDPFRVLVGTILSARSRDVMTHRVCDQLLRKYPTARKLAAAKPRDLFRILRPIGFYRQKSKFVTGAAKILMEKHRGRVPGTLDELLELPGVGRKVANCVLVYAFGKAAIPVDTHVHRISNRLGWVKTKTPEETERELARILPRRHWLAINELLVAHGKEVCGPISVKCGECPAEKWCAKRGLTNRAASSRGERSRG
jgi:endonuclease-3